MVQILSATQVSALSDDGDHHVDRNLWLQIRDGGRTRSWVMRYRHNGGLRRMGLGPASLVTFSDAKRKVIDAQKLLLGGIDPMQARDAELRTGKTFEECATAYIAAHRSGWSNEQHAYQWSQSLKTYAYPTIGTLPVEQIDANHVTRILEPLWTTKSETADRVRNRIERVLDWAKASGYRDGENPAKWKGVLEYRLPPLSRVQIITPHVAIPYSMAPEVYAKAAQSTTKSAKVLILTMLTALRVGEVLGATWQEFDLDAPIPVWALPAARMKAHRLLISAEN